MQWISGLVNQEAYSKTTVQRNCYTNATKFGPGYQETYSKTTMQRNCNANATKFGRVRRKQTTVRRHCNTNATNCGPGVKKKQPCNEIATRMKQECNEYSYAQDSVPRIPRFWGSEVPTGVGWMAKIAWAQQAQDSWIRRCKDSRFQDSRMPEFQDSRILFPGFQDSGVQRCPQG